MRQSRTLVKFASGVLVEPAFELGQRYQAQAATTDE